MPLNDFEREELKQLKRTEPSTPDLYSPRVQFDFMDFAEAIEQADRLAEMGLQLKYFIAPNVVVWELTANCPLRCQFCLGAFPRSTRNELSSAEKRALAQELIDAKIWAINLSGGDPLLCGDLPDLVDLFTANQVPVVIITSGWKLERDLARRLLKREELVAFVFSIDAPVAAVHDELRGREGALAESVRSLQLLQAEGATKLSVECVVTQKNLGYLDAMVEFCRSLHVPALRFQPVVLVGRGRDRADLALSEAQLRFLVERLQAIRGRLVEEMTTAPDKPHIQVYLIDQTTHIATGMRTGHNMGGIIEPDGTLKVSAYLPFTFGNVRQAHGFMPIWNAGYRVAWKHPELRRRISRMETIQDIERINQAAGDGPVALDTAECASPAVGAPAAGAPALAWM